MIKAQYSAAEAQVRIGEAATGIGEQMADTGLAIQRAKDKTEQVQARAAAVDELVEAARSKDFTTGGQDQLDRELAQLSASTQVDDELAKMKAEVGTGEGARSCSGDRPAHGRGAVPPLRRPPGTVGHHGQPRDPRPSSATTRRKLRFQLEQMGEAVGSEGERLDDADLHPSDLLIPPSDLSLEEAHKLFEGEGLIPDLPIPEGTVET